MINYNMNIELIHGDCLQKLKDLPDNSVSSVVCDPPYGLSFMKSGGITMFHPLKYGPSV
jgi:DNA modification methylase